MLPEFFVFFSSFDTSLGYAGHDLPPEYKKQNDQWHRNNHYRRHHGRDIFPAESVFPDLLDTIGYKIIGRISLGHT